MRLFLPIAALLCVAGCGELRTTKVAPNPVPKMELEIQSWPFKEFEHFQETMDDVHLTATLNTEEKGLERYLLSVSWTQPENFPNYAWTIYFRHGNKLTQYAWTNGNGHNTLPLPLVIELKQPLPDAVEFRLLIRIDSQICDLRPQTCPLVKSILIRQ